MATIIKNNIFNSKGIIVFTHKEKKLLSNIITSFFFKKKILQLKSLFFFSMHWGWFHKDEKDVPYIDFHLAGKGTLFFKNNNSYVINLCNRNFIDKIFIKKNFVKIYDLISISRPVKFKNIDKIFLALKNIYNKNIKLRSLVIFTITSEKLLFNNENSYSNIFDDFNKIFTNEEKEYVTLLPIYTSNTKYFLSKSEICNYLNLSKIFILPVEKEGASRVIHEALLCGLPVITYKYLQGGGLDYLNDYNSELFDNFDQIDQSILKVYNNIDKYKFDPDITRKNLSAEFQLEEFKKELIKFYNYKKVEWIDNLEGENLDRKLDGHQITLNENWIGTTNDLKDLKSLYFFIMHNLGQKPKFLTLFFIYILEKIYLTLLNIKKIIKHF